MGRKWQMLEAKARLAELVRRTASDGAQIITYRGADAAVVLSIQEYRQLSSARPNFIDHLLSGPKIDDEFVDLINEHSEDTGRDIDL